MGNKTQTEEMDKKEKKPMRKVTIRMTEDYYNEIERFANDNNTNVSTVIRYALSGHLAKYFGSRVYVDSIQTNGIKDAIILVANIMSQTNNELRRIGVNYNQQIKIMQVRRKYDEMLANSYLDPATQIDMQKQRDKELEKLNLHPSLNKDELNGIMKMYDDACVAFQKAVSDILGVNDNLMQTMGNLVL